MKIIGRENAIKKLDQIRKSREAEFVAVYGRRRVGKTFLINSYFTNQDCLYFSATGIHLGTTQQQLKA